LKPVGVVPAGEARVEKILWLVEFGYVNAQCPKKYRSYHREGDVLRHGQTIAAYAGVLLAGFALLGSAGSSCHAQMRATTISLVSDTCPNVIAGQSISLDWNPLFDPVWPVTGLRDFGLTFSAVAEDGVGVRRGGELHLGARHTAMNISPLGNGFFHIELRLSASRIPPGTYRLTDAHAIPDLDPDFKGSLPAMTRSPVEERYCITVIPSPSSQSPQPGNR
jgi:hypothetical protein